MVALAVEVTGQTDLAHAFFLPWHSLNDLQKLGKQSGILKPFANLNKEQLKEELRVIGVLDLGRKNVTFSQSYSQFCVERYNIKN